MLRIPSLIALSLVCCALASGVKADPTYNIKYTFEGYSETYTIHDWRNGGDSPLSVYGGRFQASWSDSNNKPASWPNNDPFDVYCVDLDHYDTATSTVNVKTITSPNSSDLSDDMNNRLLKIGYLYANYAADAHNDVIKSAALQAAIWNTLEDTDYKVESVGGTGQGNYFKITKYSGNDYDTIVQEADDMLLALSKANPNTHEGTYFQIVGDANRDIWSGQNMFGPTYNKRGPGAGGGDVVPEGSSLALLALGLFPVLGALRLRRRK